MTRVRAIVQCRLSSSRLPAKVLLPLGGMPLVILCARRAANTGAEVWVATSGEPSDDELARVVTSHGIRCVRGPLHDVQRRFLLAAEDLPDEAVLVRLTADNVFPDGAFIEQLVQALWRRSASYLGTHSPFDGLPYGLSAEAFTVGALRRAASNSATPAEREHVTPALRRAGSTPFRPVGLKEDLGHLRCTVDNWDDYLTMIRVFDTIADPVGISWKDLCAKLAALEDAPAFRIPFRARGGKPASVLTLGTAQLGLPRYGKTNTTGRPERAQAVEMVRQAVRHGVTAVDCARAYGQAEAIVGAALERLPREAVTVVTKLEPLDWLASDANEPAVGAATEASVLRSCRELRSSRLDVLLLHRWAHRTSHGGAIWKNLKRFQAEGCIGLLGASVYTPREALEALADPDVRHVQLPFNLLDARWREAGIPEKVRARGDVVVHARSVFLQGLLAAPAESWPAIPGVDARYWTARLDELVRELGRQDRADLCVAYARAQDWIDSLVIGMESPVQLEANLASALRPPLAMGEIGRVEAVLSGAPIRLLDPSRWS